MRERERENEREREKQIKEREEPLKQHKPRLTGKQVSERVSERAATVALLMVEE